MVETNYFSGTQLSPERQQTLFRAYPEHFDSAGDRSDPQAIVFCELCEQYQGQLPRLLGDSRDFGLASGSLTTTWIVVAELARLLT